MVVAVGYFVTNFPLPQTLPPNTIARRTSRIGTDCVATVRSPRNFVSTCTPIRVPRACFASSALRSQSVSTILATVRAFVIPRALRSPLSAFASIIIRTTALQSLASCAAFVALNPTMWDSVCTFVAIVSYDSLRAFARHGRDSLPLAFVCGAIQRESVRGHG